MTKKIKCIKGTQITKYNIQGVAYYYQIIPKLKKKK